MDGDFSSSIFIALKPTFLVKMRLWGIVKCFTTLWNGQMIKYPNKNTKVVIIPKLINSCFVSASCSLNTISQQCCLHSDILSMILDGFENLQYAPNWLSKVGVALHQGCALSTFTDTVVQTSETFVDIHFSGFGIVPYILKASQMNWEPMATWIWKTWNHTMIFVFGHQSTWYFICKAQLG